MTSKESVRVEMRRRLSEQSPEDRRVRSRAIQEKLFGLPEFAGAPCVLFFVALPTEVDTTAMIEGAWALGKRVAVPRVTDLENKELSLYEIGNLNEDLKPGALGILEPRAEKTSGVPLDQIRCAVVPGLAFDRSGHRLGRGAGFYDRLLSRLNPKVPKIGLAFSFQVLPRIPHTPCDQKMDKVLTD